ncbi:MAG: Transglutaminase-like superfamily protein [Candidatus Bathyarchaeota archaeon BA1]|nr:MAG: Transglutaminase-like superfamily protein [Candidatus Bathyarchaeota archaeon BA1]
MLTLLILAIFTFATIFVPISKVNPISVPEKVRLFDPKTLYIHGYTGYRYNSSAPAERVPVFLDLWANNFWSDVSILQTSPRSSSVYAKYDADKGEYIQIPHKDDHDAIYGATFEFLNVQPYQEVKVDVWIKLSVSKVDMSRILREDVGSVSEAKAQVHPRYLQEAYYWDYGNSSVQHVIQEINATIRGSQNVYDIVYGCINWFSIHMIYMEHEDYPHQRLKASQILSEKIIVPGYGEKRYGVCRHFVDAFIAIMRGFGIPANLFYGLVFYDYGGTVGVLFAGGHAWCEVYMPNIGWVPVEVTIPNKYYRDIIRVGLISEYYYLPIFKEFTNTKPTPPKEPREHLIGAYWGWGVNEPPPAPIGTLEGITHIITSMPIVDWVLLIIIAILVVDRFMIRRKIKALALHIRFK